MATYQTVLAREAGCSVRLIQRTEATSRILGIYTAARWWQDPNRKPVPYDRTRRTPGQADRWRRRLRVDQLLMLLLTDRTLSGWQRRALTNRLRLQIIARAIEALTANPGPLLPTLTRTTGRVPPLSASGLPRSTWERALGLPPLPSNTPDASVGGYPSGTKAVPSGSDFQRFTSSLRSSVTDLPSGSPPVNPTNYVGSSASLRPEVTGDSPSGPASAEGFHPPLQDEGHPQEELWEVWARFWSADQAGLRRYLRREITRDGIPALTDWQRGWLTHTIACALPCTYENAYDLLLRFVEILPRLHLQEPAAPRGRPARTVTDLRGHTWVLTWEQPTRET
jgi:hypothetical protein